MIDIADVLATMAARRRNLIDRYTQHLDEIPAILEEVRDRMTRLKSSRADDVRVSGGGDVRRAPFDVTAADDGDDLWGALVEYVNEVAEHLNVPSPVTTGTTWSTRTGRIQGLSAGLPGARAAGYGFVVIGWLCDRVETILDLDLRDSEAHLFGLIRKLRGRYTGDDQPRRARPRDCPLCLAGRVRVVWVDGEGTTGTARCDLCGDENEITTEGTEDMTAETPNHEDGALLRAIADDIIDAVPGADHENGSER